MAHPDKDNPMEGIFTDIAWKVDPLKPFWRYDTVFRFENSSTKITETYYMRMLCFKCDENNAVITVIIRLNPHKNSMCGSCIKRTKDDKDVDCNNNKCPFYDPM